MTCTCRLDSLASGEPMAGTAPRNRDWLLVEHPGPWGHDAVADAGLPDAFLAWARGLPDTRVQLIRRHGRTAPGGSLTAFRCVDGELSRTAFTSADELPAADWAPHAGPVLAVCTNAKRDECCAVYGRPVAARLTARWPVETWETSHLGGHRFAATMVVLPASVCLGRLDPDAAEAEVARLLAGEPPTPALTRTPASPAAG